MLQLRGVPQQLKTILYCITLNAMVQDRYLSCIRGLWTYTAIRTVDILYLKQRHSTHDCAIHCKISITINFIMVSSVAHLLSQHLAMKNAQNM